MLGRNTYYTSAVARRYSTARRRYGAFDVGGGYTRQMGSSSTAAVVIVPQIQVTLRSWRYHRPRRTRLSSARVRRVLPPIGTETKPMVDFPVPYEMVMISGPAKSVLEPQFCFGDKPVKFQVICPQNGAAVLKGLKNPIAVKSYHYCHRKGEQATAYHFFEKIVEDLCVRNEHD